MLLHSAQAPCIAIHDRALVAVTSEARVNQRLLELPKLEKKLRRPPSYSELGASKNFELLRATQSRAGQGRAGPCPALPCPALPCPALPCPAEEDLDPKGGERGLLQTIGKLSSTFGCTSK